MYSTYIERDVQMKQLENFYLESRKGKGQICFVVGEAGAGKTTLINSFISNHKNTNLLVAVGQCNSQTGLADPYLPFREILSMLLGDNNTKLSDTIHNNANKGFVKKSIDILLHHGPDLVATLIPTTALLAIGAKILIDQTNLLQYTKRKNFTQPNISEVSETRIFQQYTTVLQTISKEIPIVLVIDDLHWVDNASANLLFHITRKLENSPILVIGSYRPNDIMLNKSNIRHPLEPILTEIKRYKGDVLINLTNVDDSQKRKFVNDAINIRRNKISNDFREKLFSLTQGNALFVTEMIENMREQGYLIQDDHGFWVENENINWGKLPSRIEGVIEERIQRLDENLQQILSIASVEGESFTAQVITKLEKISERQTLRYLSQDLEKRHHLIHGEGEIKLSQTILSLYRFNHALFHQYIYNNLSTSERRLLHREIAQILESLYNDQLEKIFVQLAYHYKKSGSPEKAIHYLVLGGDKGLQISAFRESEVLLKDALSLNPNDKSMLMLITRKLGRVYYGLGELNLAKDFLQQTVNIAYDLDNKLGMAIGQTRLGHVLVDLGEFESAKYELTTALHIANLVGDKETISHALSELGYVTCQLGELQAAKIFYQDSLIISRSLDHKHLIMRTLYDLGCCLHLLGEYTNCKDVLKESISIANQIGNKDVAVYSLNELGWTFYDEKSYNESQMCFKNGLDMAKEIDNKWTTSESLNGLGFVTCQLGNFLESKRYFYEALQLSYNIKAMTEIVLVLVGIAQLLIHLREIEKAIQLLGLSLHHYGSDSEVKHFANQVLDNVKDYLTQEELLILLEQGKTLNLDLLIPELFTILDR